MKTIWKYLITFAVGAVFTVIMLVIFGTFGKTAPAAVFQDLADSFFVSGFVLFGAGMLVFLTNGGAFDALGFGFVKLIDSFRKNVRNTKYQTYYDYANEKKSEQRSFLHIVLVGIGFIAVAVVFYFLYQNALQQLQQATALLW